MGSKAKNVAYIGRILPAISETFVTREIKALRSLGCSVFPFSLFKPDPDEIHPEDAELATETVILYSPMTPLFWIAHLFYFFAHPVLYFRMVGLTLFNSRYTFKERVRLAGQFLMAPYAAWKMKRLNIDHIHAHFANSPTLVAMFAAELLGIGFSFTSHAFDIFFENQLLAEKISKASFAATVSEFNRTHFLKTYPEAAQAEIPIIRCAVDTEHFSPVSHQRSIPPKILSVGRLVDFKGFDILIRAVAILKNKKIGVSCSIIGEGSERPFLEKLIDEQNVSDRVFLVGQKFQDEIFNYYSEADMFVLPCVERRKGDADNLPVVLMEALAMKIPTVSTPLRAVPEIIIDNKTGRLAPLDDPDALAEIMEDLINDPQKAEALAGSGAQFVREEFNSKINAEKLLALFG